MNLNLCHIRSRAVSKLFGDRIGKLPELFCCCSVPGHIECLFLPQHTHDKTQVAEMIEYGRGNRVDSRDQAALDKSHSMRPDLGQRDRTLRCFSVHAKSQIKHGGNDFFRQERLEHLPGRRSPERQD